MPKKYPCPNLTFSDNLNYIILKWALPQHPCTLYPVLCNPRALLPQAPRGIDAFIQTLH
jgi:hypothetical protein